MADIFDTIAPEASPQGDIFDKVAAPQSQGTLLDSIMTNLSRPGAAVRNAFLGNQPDLPKRLQAGWQSPQKAPDFVGALPYAPTGNPFLSELQTTANAGIGSVLNLASDPINYVPLPIGRALGAGLERFAPPAAKWLAEQTRNINPKWNARLNPPPVSIQDILSKIEPTPQVAPAAVPPPDETSAYQAWLQKNAQSDTPQNPIMNVPLHPAEDARVALADLIPKPVPSGQLYPKELGPQQYGFPEILNSSTKNKVLPTPPEVVSPEASPIRDQGQQSFDFTQGPAAPTVMPQDNAIQLSAQVQKEIDGIARMPNGARPAPYRGLDKQQIQDMFVQRIAGKQVKQLPEAFDPYSIPGEMKKLKSGTGQGDMFEIMATESDKLRREQLIKDRQSVDALVKTEESATEDPSTLQDIQTILSDIKLKKQDPNIIELNAGAKPPDFELGPEGQAALDKQKAKIEAFMKATGKSAADAIKELHPQLSLEEAKALADVSKIGNLNLKQYPDAQKQQLRDLYAGQEKRLVTKPMTDKQITEKANELTSLPVTEMIGRSGEGQTAAEIRRRVMTDISKMKAISEDTGLSSQETVQKIIQVGTEKTKKIKTEVGRALGSMKTPLEAQQESLAAMRKIVERLRSDPSLSSAESKGLIGRIKTQFPETEKATTPAEIFKFMFRNFITSSPRTLAINATSGYGNIAARPVMRTLEVTAAKIRSLLTGNPTSATYKEIGAMLQGMDAALRQGKQLPESLKAKTFSDKYNVSPLEAAASSAKTKAGATALDVTSKVIGAPETIMRKTDEHVKNVLGMMEMYASKARGEDVFADQTAIDRITSAQARGSFQDEMSSIGKWVAQARNYFAHQEPTAFNQSMDILTYALQPFIQTVDRIIAKGWNTSVLGAPTVAVKGMAGTYAGAMAKGVAHNPVAAEKLDRDVASAMIGIPLFVWAASQLASGNITGSAPADSAGREAFGNAGKTEYSIKTNGRWVQLRDIPEPMSTALQINIALIQGMADAKDKGKGMAESAFGVAQKIGTMLGTKQYLGGMNSLISSLSAKDSVDTVNELPITKKILPSVAIPSVVKDVGVLKDTLQGRPRVMADTAVEALKRRAGATSGMVPELNTFGEAVTHPMMGQVNNDPAYALAEKFPPQPVERTRDGVKLSQQEYHALKQNVGQQRKQVFEALANNDAFMQAPKGLQQIVVEDMVAVADKIGTTPQKIKEIQKDPLYYNKKLRTLLEIQQPGGERHFPFLK